MGSSFFCTKITSSIMRDVKVLFYLLIKLIWQLYYNCQRLSRR
nr:MAG TPA: hypothetical protein [Caudoviricetes sp.]